MAEEQNQPAAAQIPVPPTQGATQFAIAVSPSDLLLSLGHARVIVTQTAAGVVPQPFIEWFLTLSLSPPAAFTLSEQLRAALANYESNFGKIPADPKMKIEIKQQS